MNRWARLLLFVLLPFGGLAAAAWYGWRWWKARQGDDTGGDEGDGGDDTSTDTDDASLGTDPEVTALQLDADTSRIAQYLKTRFPSIRFTSGYRKPVDQARAMAQNCARKGGGAGASAWIRKTYTKSKPSVALAQWCDDHPEATSTADIQAGFEQVVSTFTTDDLGSLSKHIKHRAFDVKPMVDSDGAPTRDGVAVHDALTKIGKAVGRYLDKEGGLIRWHLQLADDTDSDTVSEALAA